MTFKFKFDGGNKKAPKIFDPRSFFFFYQSFRQSSKTFIESAKNGSLFLSTSIKTLVSIKIFIIHISHEDFLPTLFFIEIVRQRLSRIFAEFENPLECFAIFCDSFLFCELFASFSLHKKNQRRKSRFRNCFQNLKSFLS